MTSMRLFPLHLAGRQILRPVLTLIWGPTHTPSLILSSLILGSLFFKYINPVLFRSIILTKFFMSPSMMGTAVAQWLRCFARKVAGSIPAGVIGIFHWHKIFPIALWHWGRHSLYWVPVVFPGGKGDRCVRLTTYRHPVPLSRNLGTFAS